MDRNPGSTEEMESRDEGPHNPVQITRDGGNQRVLEDDVFTGNLLTFFRGLRRLGMVVGPAEEQLALAALDSVGWEDADVCRTAVQAVVVKHPQHLPLFHAAWRQFWRSLHWPPSPLNEQTLLAQVAQRWVQRRGAPRVSWMGHAGAADAADAGRVSLVARTGASLEEHLRHRDFVRMTEEEWAQLQRWQVRVQPLWRPGRRWQPAARGQEVDWPATLREGVRGTAAPVAWRSQPRRQRPVLVVCDVSGSMEPYSRGLLRFLHALLLAGVQLDGFAFSTRLTRVTSALRYRDPDRALRETADRVTDFAGGTRLADALSALRQRWAGVALQPGACVVLATDGLDAGDADELERELQRLARRAYRLVWWNPLAGLPGFVPAARGQQQLARYVDAMLPAGSWGQLEQAWQGLGKVTRRVRRAGE
ncbi:MAG: VWA domain-containing protein [Alicyclobacillus sp.]|nr:VWA domain-containing protein [Alicyclobacillus sp.]